MANGIDMVGQALAQRGQGQVAPQPQAQDPTAGLQSMIDTQQTTLEGLEGELTQTQMVIQELVTGYTELAQMVQAIMMAMQGGQPQGQPMPQGQMPPQGV